MKAIVNSLNKVVYMYEGEEQYPSCLAVNEGYKHIDISNEVLNQHWFRIKWDPITEMFMDYPLPVGINIKN
jgi:hypothetical protein